MNILYLCLDRGIPIRGHKGASVHVRALIDAFAQAGHSVTLMTPRGGPVAGPTVAAQVVEVPFPAEANVPPTAYADVALAAAIELMAAHPFDFIYERYSLWSDVGARLTQVTGKPLVLEVNAPLRTEAAAYRHIEDDETAARVEVEQFQHATIISVVSEELRQYVVQRGGTTEKLCVLPNGVDPQLFHPAVRYASARAELNLKDKLVVGFVGRPRPWHDLDTLLKAIEQAHSVDHRFHLLLVGDMPPAVQVFAAEHPALITLTGPVAHHLVPRYLGTMDIAVSPHPALASFYFSPLKLVEYMACGVPSIAANLGQPAQIIRHNENGWLYPPGDARALADCLHQLAAQSQETRDIAWQGAVEIHDRYTWGHNARAIIDHLGPPPIKIVDPPAWPRPVSLPIFDSKLRARLFRATRLDLATPLLAHAVKPASVIEQIQVLKYKPRRRCVLAYTFADGRSVIGKLYRDERGQRLTQLQEFLWHHGFGLDAADHIHVPQALAYVSELYLLVQAHAPGETLNELIAHKADPLPLMRQSAHALAKLHNTPLPEINLLGTYGLETELLNLTHYADELQQHRPDFVVEAKALYKVLMVWGDRLPELAVPTLIHRDFYYSQLLFTDASVTLIDFDLLALGDPAIDVANFIAHLFLLGLDRLNNASALATAATEFLATYASQCLVDEAFEQRLVFYEAATYFRLLNVVRTRPGLTHCFEPLWWRLNECLKQALGAH